MVLAINALSTLSFSAKASATVVLPVAFGEAAANSIALTAVACDARALTCSPVNRVNKIA